MSKTHVWVMWGVVIITLLPGCRGRRRASSGYSNQLSIRLHLLEGDSTSLTTRNRVLERAWSSDRKWRPRRSHMWLNLEVVSENENQRLPHRSFRIEEQEDTIWPESEQPGESIYLSFESDLGTVAFSGETHETGASGQVQIDVNAAQVSLLKDTFGDMPSLELALSLICREVDASDMLAYAHCGVQFDVQQAGDMARCDFGPENVTKLVNSGYRSDAEGYVELARHRVTYDYIMTWQEQGCTLAVDQLVYAKQRNLDADMARQWKDAGYDVNVEEVYWIKTRNLKPASAVAWKQAEFDLTLDQLYWAKTRNLDPVSAIDWAAAGYELDLEDLYWAKTRNLRTTSAVAWQETGYDFDLKQLYWVKTRNLKPKTAAQWKRQGYDLDPEQLEWAKTRNVTPADARQWKEAGYTLSVKDLYELDRYNVDPDFGAALADPSFEPLTVKDLIKLKQSNISEDTLKRLRRPRQP